MSEKDSVSSQDIPAVLRTLGTLALAAATAIAIKWIISRDNMEKDKEENLKFQCKVDPIEDGQSSEDNPKEDEGPLENNKKEHEVSDKPGMTGLPIDCFPHGILKRVLDSSCPNILFEKGDMKSPTDQKRLLRDITSVCYKLNNVSSPKSISHNPCEENAGISGLPAVIVDDSINDTQTEVFSSCFTQTYDMTFYERSQDQQLDTSSSYGECTDVMNVHLECQCQPTGGDNLMPAICSKHKHVDIGLVEDLFNNENLNCDSKMDTESHIKPSAENRDNTASLHSGINPEGNTKEHISDRQNPLYICAPSLPESQENITAFIGPPAHKVLTGCHNTKQQTGYTTNNMQDILQTVGANDITITMSSEDTVLTNSNCESKCQGEKNSSKDNNHVTCAEQSGIEHKIHVTSIQTVKETNENLKCSNMSYIPASAHVPEEHVTVEENRVLFSSVDILHNNDQINGGSPNHTELLCLPEAGVMDEMKTKSIIYHHTNHVLQWNTTTVYNATENSYLMYPTNCHEPENSITPLIENNEGQSSIQNNVLLSTKKSMSEYKESEYNHLDADIESSFKSSTFHSIKLIQSSMTRNALYDPSTLNTFSSTMVTKTESQSLKSTSDNGQDNDEMFYLRKHDANSLIMDKNELSSSKILTNGYVSGFKKQADINSFGCSYEKCKLEECCDKQQSSVSKALSNFLQNPTEEASCRFLSSYKDNNAVSYVMKKMPKTELNFQQTQAIMEDPNLSKEKMATNRVEQRSHSADSLRSSAEYLGQYSFDNTDSSSNNAYFEQGSVNPYTASSFHQELKRPLQSKDQKILDKVKSNTESFSRERIKATFIESTELSVAEYQSVFTESKKPFMTKSCDNIYSGPSCHGSALKNKAQSMLCLLTEYYTAKLHSENGPLEKVARGCFIRIPKGFQNIQEGVRFQLTLGNCLELLKLARKNSVPELLKEVYKLISDNYLHVLKNSAIYGQLTGLEREKILQLRMRGKMSLCMVETQSIFGLNKNISCSEDTHQDQPKVQLFSLDMDLNQWKQVTNIPDEACLKGCSICSMHNYLFIAGGIQRSKNGLICSNKLFCYNPLTDIWTQLTPMNQARSQLKLVPLDGYLYAIGGECLHTMERYDPRSNKWIFVASLPKGHFAVAHEAAACGGEIYISGGHLFFRLLKYNPVRDLWEECPFNASKGRSCDMVAVGHILYRFDMQKDSTVHIFKYNTTAKVWSEYTTTFPKSKLPFRCAVLGGTIYCINKEITARFAVEGESARFESTIFNKVPTKGIGHPCPVVLSLQEALSQTSV